MTTFADLITRVYVRFKTEETGATGVEYGMLVALIAAVMVAGASLLSDQVTEAFNTITNALTTESVTDGDPTTVGG
ncbi:MAG: Flp family type IVb pilin [Actinomycetota bacterium]|nr:Flp family type IVb pilin [Actinomycetota bacterium]